MVSCIIKSNNTLIIEIIDDFADQDLNSIFLLLESLTDEHTQTNIYFKIASNIKKHVHQRLENTLCLRQYQICYVPKY